MSAKAAMEAVETNESTAVPSFVISLTYVSVNYYANLSENIS
jgi:hypothetical protein